MQVLHPSRRAKNITLYGAVGKDLGTFFKIGKSTNKEEFMAFLIELKAKSNKAQLTVVLDNHSAHKSSYVRDSCKDEGIKLLF